MPGVIGISQWKAGAVTPEIYVSHAADKVNVETQGENVRILIESLDDDVTDMTLTPDAYKALRQAIGDYDAGE